MIALFVLGYLMIALEHVLNVNKATFALLMSGILWAVYAMCSHDPNLSEDMVVALGDTCEIVVFLIGAMTIVELIDRYGGFNIIVHRIHAKNKRGLMWVLALVAFFMSSILDNMTTTIIMVMMLRRLLSNQKERWLFACVIVLAANSGGAWWRHHHHNALDEKLCELCRPDSQPAHTIAGICGNTDLHSHAICEKRTRGTAQFRRPTHRI